MVFFKMGNGFEIIIGEGAEGSDITILDTDENRFIAYLPAGVPPARRQVSIPAQLGLILDKEDMILLQNNI
jgi:hypothetical protein